MSRKARAAEPRGISLLGLTLIRTRDLREALRAGLAAAAAPGRAAEPGPRPEATPAATRRPDTDPTRRPGTDPTRRPGTDPTRRPGTDPTRRPGTDPAAAGLGLTAGPGHLATAEGEPPAVVRELVRLADRLPDLTGENAPRDPEQAAVITRWLEERARALLTACDVVPVEDSGPLDLGRHEVVGTRAAPAGDLVHHIADTVRPGYTWQGRLLRPQQVVAYVAATGDRK
jgi:hypothetical protein